MIRSRRSRIALSLGALLAIAGPAGAQVGTVDAEQKIADGVGGFPAGVLDATDIFGNACAALGDLDDDGVTDLAVGAVFDDDGGASQGAVWILFLNADGTVKATQKISETAGGLGAVLDPGDFFGRAVAGLGDLDGDGVEDLAVGAERDDDLADRGAVWILFLNTDGTVKASQKISPTAGGFGGTLDSLDFFGGSLAFLGDLDGDGVGDLAVGAYGDDDGGSAQGAMWILFLDTDGTVQASQKISETVGGFGGVLDVGDSFGYSSAPVGDLDGDGVTDLAVGAHHDDDGGIDQGAVWILFLNTDGTVKASQKISETVGGFGGPLAGSDQFGVSISDVGDLDSDGVTDLAVGANFDDDGGSAQGAVWILFLDTDGTVQAEQKISETTGGLTGPLDPNDAFGVSVAGLGDFDGDGASELAVGAERDDGAFGDQGAVYVLFLEGIPDTTAPVLSCPGDFAVECTGPATVVTFTVTATDDLDPSPSVVCTPPSGSVFPMGVTTVSCFATDASGNSSFCVFDVTVEDTLPPVVTCPSDATIECTNPGGEVVTYDPSATDVCDPAPGVVAVPPSGSVFALGTTTVTVTATDASGNAAVCTFDVTVEDTTDPIVACPADIVLECTNPGGEVVSYTPTASDLCDPAPAVVAVPPSGSVFGLGTTTVTVTATDASGNDAVCTFDVTIQDTTAPVVSCPADIVLECTNPGGEVVVYTPTATDACDPAPGVVAVPPSGSVFALGTTTVTVTATDASGNAAVCTFDVTIQDTTDPVVTCPADIVLECTSPGGEVVVYTPTATDACDPAPSVVAVPPSGSVFALGTITVTVTATDASGNDAVCTFDVTIEDTTPPAIVCPPDLTVFLSELAPASGGPATPVVFADPAVTDACDPAPLLACVPPSGSVFPWGTTTVTCTATDASGNAAPCTFDVTVRPEVETFTPLGTVVLPAVASLPESATAGPVSLLRPADRGVLLFEVEGAASASLSDGSTRRDLFRLHEVSAGAPRTVFADLDVLFPDSAGGSVLRLELEPADSARASEPRFHAGTRLRNGRGANPAIFVGAGVVAGAPWTAYVDVSARPDARASLVVVSTRALEGTPTPFGELLIELLPRPLLTSLAASGGAVDVHALPLPGADALLGRTLHAQAAILGERLAWTNAVDLLLGP